MRNTNDSQYEYWSTVFTNLDRDGFEKTSQATSRYNCIAHAAGDAKRWWTDHRESDDEYYWPENARRDGHIDGLVLVFESLGYVLCNDSGLETGYEKVALYVKDRDMWEHAARQLPDGKWTTKDGENADFSHASPACLSPYYGRVHCYMKRPRMPSQ